MAITIIEAAPDKLLTKVSTAKGVLGITDATYDAVLEQQIEEVSDFIQTYTGRIFAKQKVAETVRGDGLLDLMLSITPILTITSVEFDDSIVDDYVIADADVGILQREQGWTSTNVPWNTISPHPSSMYKLSWKITYTGGFVLPGWGGTVARTLPYDLERAALEMVKTNFKTRNIDGSLKSYKIGETQATWAKDNSGNGAMNSIPSSALNILDYWRRPY